MKILITGAAGYLGSHLVRSFRDQGHEVATIRRAAESADEPCENDFVLSADYRNIGEIVSTVNPDAVIHTAAASYGDESSRSVEEMVAANVLFGSMLLAEMKKHDVKKFIQCGTSWQNSDGLEYSPFNFYAASKEAFEKIVEYYCLQGLQAWSFRLFDSYGPRDRRRKILNLMIEAAVKGETLEMSPGHQKLVLVHVDDISRAFEQVLVGRSSSIVGHQIYSLWHPGGVSLRELADIIGRVSNLKCSINWGGRKYRQGEIMDPVSHYPPAPGWEPQVSLEDGVREIIAAKLAGA